MNRRATKYVVLHRCEVGFDEYGAVVRRDGSIYTAYDTWDAHTPHAKDYNDVAFGLGFEGAFATCYEHAKYPLPTPAQLSKGARFVAALLDKYDLGLECVRGHSQLGPAGTRDLYKLQTRNSCPGDRWPWSEFLGLVHSCLRDYYGQK